MTIDLDAIVANWRKLEKTGVPAECAGVVKANAYGCGAAEVARALSNAGCKTFFVATLDEAKAVRAAVPASAAIYVLSGFFQNSGEAYANIDCRPVIGDLNELAEWDVFCRRSGWSGGAAVHLDARLSKAPRGSNSVETRCAGWPGTRTLSPWLLAVSSVSTMCR